MNQLLILFFWGAFSLSSWAQVWKPLKDTCDQVADTATSEHLGMSYKVFEALSEDDAYAAATRVLESKSKDYYTQFLLYIAPSKKLTEITTILSFDELHRRLCGTSTESRDLKIVIQSLKQCLVKTFQNSPETASYKNQQAGFFTPDADQILETRKSLNTFCRGMNLPGALCQGDLIKLIGLYNTTSLTFGTQVTIPHEVVKISGDPKLVELSGKLVFRLLDIMLESHERRSAPQSHIFDDLISFFRSEGLSEQNARDLAFYYLGVYATRGASFLADFEDFHPKSLAALVVLSSMLSYLDKLTGNTGRHYSLPKDFETTCKLGKPYHFWLSAFLTYYSKRQDFSAGSSYYGSIFTGIGYDIRGSSNGRDINRLFQGKSAYSYYANMTRLDNWARAFGAHFGRNDGELKVTDGDGMLEGLFERAQAPRKDPEEKDFLDEYLYMIKPLPMILKLGL